MKVLDELLNLFNNNIRKYERYRVEIDKVCIDNNYPWMEQIYNTIKESVGEYNDIRDVLWNVFYVLVAANYNFSTIEEVKKYIDEFINKKFKAKEFISKNNPSLSISIELLEYYDKTTFVMEFSCKENNKLKCGFMDVDVVGLPVLDLEKAS